MKKVAVEYIPWMLRLVRQDRAQARRWELLNDKFTHVHGSAAFETPACVTAHYYLGDRADLETNFVE